MKLENYIRMQARGGGVDFLTNSYSFHSKFFFGARKCHKNVFDVYASSSKKFMLPWVLDKLPFKVSWVKKWIIGQKMHTLRQMSWLQNYAGNVHVEETFWYAKWNTAWLARLKSLSFQQIIFFFTKEPWGFFLKRGYIPIYNCSLFLQKWNIYLCRIDVPMYKYTNLKLQMLLDDCVSFLAEHKIFSQLSWEYVQKCQIFLVKHPVLITSWLIEFF